MNKKLFAMVLGLAMVSGASAALADMNNGTANYQVEIVAGCAISSSGVNFGQYAVGSPDVVGASAGQVSVTCADPMTPYLWGMDWGMHYGQGLYLGSPSGHAMSDGLGHYISYGIRNTWAGYPPPPPYPTLYLGDMGLEALDLGYVPTTPMPCASDLGGSFYGDRVFDLLADVQITEASAGGIYSDTIIFTVVFP